MTGPKLRDGIELLRGMDDLPLAYDRETGAYHRLSESAFVLLRQFDGVRTLADLAPGRPTAELAAFAESLRRRGVLEGDTAATPQRRRRSRIMPYFVLTRRLPRLLEPFAAILRGHRSPIWILLGLGLPGLAAGLLTVGRQQVGWSGWIAAAAVLVYLGQSVLHEVAHALVAQVLKVPVRGAGFALLLWVMPFGFVDRTDAYRLRSRRQRVALAMAGPLLDGVAMGVTAVIAIVTQAPVAAYLLVVQVFGLFMNLNPMLTGDGYAAIEAGFGLVDLRGRALALVNLLVRRRPLPPHLAAMPRRSRVGYFLYGVACTGYIALFCYVLLSRVAAVAFAT